MVKKNRISDRIDIHDLDDLSLKSYWVIDHETTEVKDRFTANEIADFLVEKARLNTSRQAVDYAINKKKGACHKNANGYKLMEAGVQILAAFLDREKVIFIDASQPFSARNFTFKEIIGSSYKEISVCDPFADLNTLDVIFKNFKKGVPIRFLTAKAIDKPAGIFKRHLNDLITEGFKIEFRIYNNSTLHDRYLIDEKRFWLSGNSLNYLGRKESFLVQLGDDVRQSMLATFNSRWKIGTVI